MATISRDTPCLYFTVVAKDRLPVFRTDPVKAVACAALHEARQSGGFLIFAYVLMPDHFHLVTDGAIKPSVVLRYVNGIMSHRVIEYLKEHGYSSSLEKLRHQTGPRKYKHSLVEHHSNATHLTSEAVFMQKVHYMHLNPVRARLVEQADDYRWSSVRCWKRCPLADEPLITDNDKIVWRTS